MVESLSLKSILLIALMVTIPVAEIATPNPITLTALITVRVILYLFLFNILKIKDNLLSFFYFLY